MKFQKILARAAAAGLLMGASGGAAFASCGDGILLNETFDGSLRVNSSTPDCAIISSTIAGDLIVTNPNNVLLVGNTVGGRLRVDGNAETGTATVVGNNVFGGNLVVREMATANVIDNSTSKESIRVIQNIKAIVLNNRAQNNLRCNNNTRLVASGNVSGTVLRCDPSDP